MAGHLEVVLARRDDLVALGHLALGQHGAAALVVSASRSAAFALLRGVLRHLCGARVQAVSWVVMCSLRDEAGEGRVRGEEGA